MQRIRLLIALAAVSALIAPAAGAKAPLPDAHDKALMSQLDAKVSAFRAIAASKGGNKKVDRSLNRCAALKKDPSKAFAAVFALLPALLAEVVNEFRPELTNLHDTLAGMHPDSALFRQWTTAEADAFGLILRFDNHGKKIDYCQAATVLLDKKSTAADIRDVLGVDPALLAVLFSSGSSKTSKTLDRVNPKMRAFLRAGGVSVTNAKAMTS